MGLPNQPSSSQNRTHQYVLLGLASDANLFTERSTALVGSSLMVGAFLHQYSRTCTQKYLIIEITSNYFQPTASRPTTSAQPPPLNRCQFGCSIPTAIRSSATSRSLIVQELHHDHFSPAIASCSQAEFYFSQVAQGAKCFRSICSP